MDKTNEDTTKKAICTLAYGLTCSMDEKAAVIGGLLKMLDKVYDLEKEVASLKKQLSSQGSSISELGTRTAGLQTYGGHWDGKS